MKNSTLDIIAIILLVVGGLNWGIIGLFNLDLIDSIFGPTLAGFLFVLIGISALYKVGMWISHKSK